MEARCPLSREVSSKGAKRQQTNGFKASRLAWRDYPGNESAFLPVYLTNDIIRYWKVLCLNYEANTRDARDPNKRRLINYKLKHSRLLTCYSAILYLCHLLRQQSSISTEDVRDLISLTPTGRLFRIAEEDAASRGLIDEILGLYVDFLKETDAPKKELLARFAEASYRGDRDESGRVFGDRIFELLVKIGEPTPLFRFLVV